MERELLVLQFGCLSFKDKQKRAFDRRILKNQKHSNSSVWLALFIWNANTQNDDKLATGLIWAREQKAQNFLTSAHHWHCSAKFNLKPSETTSRVAFDNSSNDKFRDAESRFLFVKSVRHADFVPSRAHPTRAPHRKVPPSGLFLANNNNRNCPSQRFIYYSRQLALSFARVQVFPFQT